MNPQMNTDNEKNKIIGIDNINCITNGTIEELNTIDPNQVGHVVRKKDNKCLGEITPIIMTIHQNKMDKESRLELLKSIGGDFDKKINYYGNNKSANDILEALS